MTKRSEFGWATFQFFEKFLGQARLAFPTVQARLNFELSHAPSSG